MSSNQDLIEKAITSTTISQQGGQLNAEQQSRFISLIRRYGVLLSMVRFVRMGRPTIDIDKLHIGEPVTVSATENTAATESYSPKFNKITLSASKIRTDWSMTTELLQGNIEQNQLEATLMRGITERMATDIELLGVQGAASTYASVDTPLGKLLRVSNGWDSQTASAHIVDVNGGAISKSVFSHMKRTMPSEFKNDAGMRFFMSDNLAVDWQDTLSARTTDLGDASLGRMGGLAPYGVPAQIVPLIPDDQTIASQTAAQAAQVTGTQMGPFFFPAATDIIVSVDATDPVLNTSPAITITLTSGAATLDAVQVAQKINAGLVAGEDVGAAYGNVARVTKYGQLELVSPTTGTGSNIVIAEGTAETVPALTVLGLTAATTTGTAAAAGSSNDGSFMWLLNPQNLIYGVLDGTRIYTEFNRNTDSIEATIFNQVAFNVENLNAIVKATNIKRAAL